MDKRWPIGLGIAAALAAVAVGFAWGATLQEQWQLAARYTARVGFPLLIVAYIARPLHQLSPSGFTRWALARRRWIGLGFACSHTIHLAALVIALRLAGETPPATTLIGGGLAYVLLYAMALTSTHSAQRAMGKWWKRLHRLGIHYLWLIFALSYFGRLFDPAIVWVGAIFGSIAIMAAGVRFAAWLKARPARRAAAA